VSEIGRQMQACWTSAGREAGLSVHVGGLPSLCHFSFEHPDELTLTSLFTQDMLERGYLASGQFKPSFAHQPHHLDAYAKHVRAVFAMLAEAVRRGDASSRLKGPPARRGFYRLT
jgi:hypothetical protein